MYIIKTDKDCDLLQDRPVLPSGKTPHEKQYCNCFNYSQNLVILLRVFVRLVNSGNKWRPPENFTE
jgi:hypothetical protein